MYFFFVFCFLRFTISGLWWLPCQPKFNVRLALLAQVDQHFQIWNECKTWGTAAEHKCEFVKQIVPVNSTCWSRCLFPGCIYYWNDWSGVLQQNQHHLHPVSTESCLSHTRTHTSTHRVTETVCVAASPGRCFCCSSRSTTHRGVTGRTRWHCWESYWSACSWHTSSCVA